MLHGPTCPTALASLTLVPTVSAPVVAIPISLTWEFGNAVSICILSPLVAMRVPPDPATVHARAGTSCQLNGPSAVATATIPIPSSTTLPVSYTHLRAHETPEHLVCRLL